MHSSGVCFIEVLLYNFWKNSLVVFQQINKRCDSAAPSMVDILNTACFLDIISIFVSLLHISVCWDIWLETTKSVRNKVWRTQASKPLAKALRALANALSKIHAARVCHGLYKSQSDFSLIWFGKFNTKSAWNYSCFHQKSQIKHMLAIYFFLPFCAYLTETKVLFWFFELHVQPKLE